MGHQEFKETGPTGHQALELIFSPAGCIAKFASHIGLISSGLLTLTVWAIGVLHAVNLLCVLACQCFQHVNVWMSYNLVHTYILHLSQMGSSK